MAAKKNRWEKEKRRRMRKRNRRTRRKEGSSPFPKICRRSRKVSNFFAAFFLFLLTGKYR